MSASPPRMSRPNQRMQMPPASNSIFEKALTRFRNSLPRDQKDKFQHCTKDDVQREIKHIQDRHGAQKRLRYMGRLSKFVEGMSQLGQVIEAFLNTHIFLAFVWGPIKFILVTASTWIDSLDCLLDVYGQIGDVLPDLTQYESLYETYPSVHKHLEEYYCDILEFHRHALKMFSIPAWKCFFLSAWKTFKTQFDPILKSLERHRILLSEEKLTAVMAETKYWGKSIDEKLERLARDLQERDRKDVERELAAHREQLNRKHHDVESRLVAPKYYDDHEIASRKRQGTSGDWILNHPFLTDWLRTFPKVNKKIYLNGIPGAGKTVLTSRLIDHLQQQQSKSKGSTEQFSLAYFYFKHLQPEKQTMVGLFLALLSQLVAQDESLLDYIYEYCTTNQQRLRSLDTLSDLVSTALQSCSLCFIILDGLDECLEASGVLKWFGNLVSNQQRDNAPGNRSPCIRLFISGQRDGIIESQMSDYSSIRLDSALEHDHDIKAFVENQAGNIREKFALESEIEHKIISHVMAASGGMFLFVKLVLDNLLAQISKYDLKQELEDDRFPIGLEQAYARVVNRVLGNPNRAEQDAARQVLGMVTCALRPLHWREIQIRFCIDNDRGESNLERELRRTCKQLCSSLVETNYLKQPVSSTCEEIVELVHPTARVYLEKAGEINIMPEHAKLALFSSRYLLSKPLVAGIPEHEVQRQATEGYYSFQDYATAFWWPHAREILKATDLDPELSQMALQAVLRVLVDIGEIEQDEDFDYTSVSLESLKRKLEQIPPSFQDWGSIKILEMRVTVIREVIESLLIRSDDAEQPKLPFYGPWRYKCPKPWCQFFKTGFEQPQYRQAHVNQHELPFMCNFQGCFATKVGFGKESDLRKHHESWHPKEDNILFDIPKGHIKRPLTLMKAVEKGDLDAIKDLVERGISLNTWTGRNGRSPVHVAAENGHLQVLQYLVDMGADPNLNTPQFGTALHKSVARHDLNITTYLCGLNSVWLSKDVHKRTALDYAVSADPFNREIIMQLLNKATPELLRDALIHAVSQKNTVAVRNLAELIDKRSFKNYEFENALGLAIKTGHLPCLEALLSSGKADPNVHIQGRDLPLHLACEMGSLPVFQRVHAATAATDLQNPMGLSLLELAIISKREKIALWILQNAADYIDRNISNGCGKRGEAPIISALKNNFETGAVYLIEKGADVDAKDENGWTPLVWALEKDNERVARLLVEKGADVDAKDEDGWTPLAWALSKDNEGVARLLVEKGADVNAGDEYGWRPLMCTIQKGFRALVSLLIDKGADISARNQGGWTPLIWASVNGDEMVVELLLEQGADTNVSDKEGWGPLTWASTKGHEKVARLLIEKGANVNACDQNGWTPLMWASNNGHDLIAELLITEGADTDASDIVGRTPLELARMQGYSTMVTLLSSRV